jgi:glucose/arabinose dehydrogenase
MLDLGLHSSMPLPVRCMVAGALLAVLVSASPGSAQQELTGLQLVVNDAATAANATNLVSVPLADHTLRLPAGFSASLLASGLAQPRFMLFDPAANLLVADMAGRVYRFTPADLPSSAPPAPLIAGLDAPSNVAFHDGFLYVGETGAISRYAYDPASGTLGGREVVVSDLPRGGHSTRTVVFGPEGEMYVSVGSSCNICDERDPRRAAISRFGADGSGGQVFAKGLRNAVGLAIQPGSGVLWATVNERDNQGNEIPPDLVTAVRGGENFGWPTCQPPYAVPQDPGSACSGITPPTIGIQAHSAPLGLAFYTGQAFPPDYAGDLFVAQHGSWNRTPPAQSKLLRIHFDGGVPTAAQDFATGWQDASGNRWGRPVGLAVAPDGSLVVSDDQSGALYRINYATAA